MFKPVADASGGRPASAGRVRTTAAPPGAVRTRSTESLTVSVAAVNDAPVIDTTNSTRAYPIGTAAVADRSGADGGRVDHTQLTGATVGIAGGYVSGRDQLSFTTQPEITGSWVRRHRRAHPERHASATVAQYQAALASVTFRPAPPRRVRA